MSDTTTIETVRETTGGFIERARVFIYASWNELQRVTWPSQKEVRATTLVVILTSIFFGLYLFVVDYGIDAIINWIFRTFGGA